ncbi:MAG: hypothetical protein Q9218_004976 [Villophora microphyllina]
MRSCDTAELEISGSSRGTSPDDWFKRAEPNTDHLDLGKDPKETASLALGTLHISFLCKDYLETDEGDESQECIFPEEDGRKRPRAAILDSSEGPRRNTPASDETTSVDDSLTPQSAVQDVNRLSIGAEQSQHLVYNPTVFTLTGHQIQEEGQGLVKQNPINEPHRIVNIKIRHKQISIKIQQQQHYGTVPKDPCASARKSSIRGQPLPMVVEDESSQGLPPLFDSETSLPVPDVLSDLLDAFFTYYIDNFGFLNRSYLDQLLARGEASVFLVCSMAALSSRFCSPAKFAKYLPPKEDGSLRQGWELSDPFLERAKSLLLPLLGIPSCDVIGGMILLSLAEFGNNSEAGEYQEQSWF